MQTLKTLLVFQRKIFFPTLVIACLIGVLASQAESSFFTGTGLGYLFCAPLVHYTVYDIRRGNEYYFYYNLGLGKPTLWISTAVVGLLICIVGISL